MKEKKIIFVSQFFLYAALFGSYFYKFYGKSEIIHIRSKKDKKRQYSIKYLSKERKKYAKDVKLLMDEIYENLNSTLPSSDIYNFNKHDCTPYIIRSPYTYQVLKIWKDVFFYSNKLYDPTIAIVFNKIKNKDDLIKTKNRENIRFKNLFLSTKPFIGFDYVMINKNRLKKLKPEVKLNVDNLISSCQAKNISSFFKQNGIDNFVFFINNVIIVNGLKDGRKKFWKIAYNIPIKLSDDFNFQNENVDITRTPKEKNLKIVFKLKDRAISIINNSSRPGLIDDTYNEDLEKLEKYDNEMKQYIKKCLFEFHRHTTEEKKFSYDDFELKYSHSIILQLQERLEEIKVSKIFTRKLEWQTENYIFFPFKNYSDDELVQALQEKFLKKEMKDMRRKYLHEEMKEEKKKLQTKLEKIFITLIESESYKDYVKDILCKKEKSKEDILVNFYAKFTDYFNENFYEDNKIKFDKTKDVFIDYNIGDIITPKYLIAFVLSDNPILSKCLSLSLTMNDFNNADEILEKLKKHNCDYFVLYQNEDQLLSYKSSDRLKIKIDNYGYSISL